MRSWYWVPMLGAIVLFAGCRSRAEEPSSPPGESREAGANDSPVELDATMSRGQLERELDQLEQELTRDAGTDGGR